MIARLSLYVAVTLLVSCSPISKKALEKTFRTTDEKFQDHTGFALYDLDKRKSVFEYKAGQYFTPASNTKIFTFFATLTILGDSVPALKYVESNDSLIFWGTGDPSFLYSEVHNNSRVYSFLKETQKALYFSDHNFHSTNFGRGWAWDDYNDYYSAERSPFPVYGNLMTLTADRKKIWIDPPYLKSYVKVGLDERKPKVIRRLEANEFVFHPSPYQKNYKATVPLKMSSELTASLLSDTLKKIVRLIQKPPTKNFRVLYSLPVDSLIAPMMQESDNFIAEQLLLMCSQTLADSLKPEIAIDYITENFLVDLMDKPRWVDGSGLSRYNLFTPRSIVQVWQKIYQRVPRERLFALLAAGGRSGTIKNWYSADAPYIFGKTGSLSNNHSLSGYLVTKSGKTLVFSFMNNNYTISINEIRRNMETILKTIYEKY